VTLPSVFSFRRLLTLSSLAAFGLVAVRKVGDRISIRQRMLHPANN